MLKRHHDRSEAQAALTVEPNALSAEQAQKAQQIRNELKALEKELVSLLGATDNTNPQAKKNPSALKDE